MSEPKSPTIMESMLAQQRAAFGQDGFDAAVKRLESAAKLTGLCMHTASGIWRCELEMMTKGSHHLAAVTESLLTETDLEHGTARPAETVKIALEETIQEIRHLNDLMRAGSFEIYDAFVRTLMPAIPLQAAAKPAVHTTKRLSAAA
jgi:hypothetical protein